MHASYRSTAVRLLASPLVVCCSCKRTAVAELADRETAGAGVYRKYNGRPQIAQQPRAALRRAGRHAYMPLQNDWEMRLYRPPTHIFSLVGLEIFFNVSRVFLNSSNCKMAGKMLLYRPPTQISR